MKQIKHSLRTVTNCFICCLAVVCSQAADKVYHAVVAVDGSGDYTLVQAAIDDLQCE